MTSEMRAMRAKADGYRLGWVQAVETILRDIETLPSERLEGGGSIAPDAFGKMVEVIGWPNVRGILNDALESIGERVPERPDKRPTMAEMDR